MQIKSQMACEEIKLPAVMVIVPLTTNTPADVICEYVVQRLIIPLGDNHWAHLYGMPACQPPTQASSALHAHSHNYAGSL